MNARDAVFESALAIRSDIDAGALLTQAAA